MARSIPELIGFDDRELKAARALCEQECRSLPDQLRYMLRIEAAKHGLWTEEVSHDERTDERSQSTHGGAVPGR